MLYIKYQVFIDKVTNYDNTLLSKSLLLSISSTIIKLSFVKFVLIPNQYIRRNQDFTAFRFNIGTLMKKNPTYRGQMLPLSWIYNMVSMK